MMTCAGLSKALAIPWRYYGCDLRSRFNWDLGNNSQDILTQESNSHPGFLARVFYFSTLLTTFVRSLVSLKWIKRSRVLLSLKQKDFLPQTGHGEILMTRICLGRLRKRENRKIAKVIGVKRMRQTRALCRIQNQAFQRERMKGINYRPEFWWFGLKVP